MTPYHAPKQRPPSAIAWSIPSPPRFALQPGQTMDSSAATVFCCDGVWHSRIDWACEKLKIFGAKLLTYMGLWPFCANHHNPGSCLKQTNSSGLPNFHHASLQHTRCTASFSLRSTIWINWMPAAAIQKANAETNSDHHHAPWGA